MTESFFGLDPKLGVKVILWSNLLENLFFYVLSLVLMIRSRASGEESEYKSILLYQEEFNSHVRWRESNKRL
jgi:hypothetical protein